ncbi:MAG TPA: tetratricopeptide repeat protein [Bacteroidales bacterium]|nr:tetratricopeptide repeat protein [Bacteroidales bacterium]
MKKFSLLLGFLMAVSIGFSQKKNVISCWSFMKDGFYEDAKEVIDKAAEDPTTKEWYKTWWYFGQTYHALGVSDKAKDKKLCNNECLDKAFEAYLKAITFNFLDPEMKKLNLESEVDLIKFFGALNNSDTKFEDDEAFIDIISNRLPGLSNAFVNKGVDAFQNLSDYKKSLDYFEKAILASTLSMQVDTQVFYFASLAAKKAEEFEKAIQYNDALIQMNFGANNEEKANIYLNQAQCYAATGDTVKMLETLQKGIEKYPDNSYNLIIETFNYYVSNGQNEKAYQYISMAIDKNPNDPQFYVIRGTLLEQMNRRKDASNEYLKALELDPENADAIYSMGAFYYNQAADTLEWANVNIPPTDFTAFEAVVAASKELFKKAIPYLEKSHAINPKDINVLNTLKTIYYRLGDMPKHDAIKAELDALTQ